MREDGLKGVIRGQRCRTTIPERCSPRPPDLVNRRFTASRPTQLWVAGLTHIRTWSGWVYVAFVLDLYSRIILGRQLATHMRTDLPLDAHPKPAQADVTVHCRSWYPRCRDVAAAVAVAVADRFDA